MSIPSQNEFLLPVLDILSDGATHTRSELMFTLAKQCCIARLKVPDVTQWETWLNLPPASPDVAHGDTRKG